MSSLLPWNIRRGLRRARKEALERAELNAPDGEMARGVVGASFAHLRAPEDADAEMLHEIAEAKRDAISLTRLVGRKP